MCKVRGHLRKPCQMQGPLLPVTRGRKIWVGSQGNAWPEGSRRFLLAGRSIAGSFRFACGGFLGDWAWHSKFFFPEVHGSSHGYICHRCCASRYRWRLRFQDRSRHAGWRQTVITTEDFLDSLPLVHNPIYDLPGFCLSLIRCDFMHCCFLGLFQITCANMIWELLALDHFCPSVYNVAARLSFAFASLKTYALSHRFTLDLPTFTPSTVGSPSHPDLGCKAHDVRIMVGWLSKQCLQAADKDTPHGKLRATIAWAQEELCFSIEQAPRYLVDDHARNRVVDAGHKFLDLYVSVSEPSRTAAQNNGCFFEKHILLSICWRTCSATFTTLGSFLDGPMRH